MLFKPSIDKKMEIYPINLCVQFNKDATGRKNIVQFYSIQIGY